MVFQHSIQDMTDTSNNRQFDSGAQRDTGDGKLCMSLVPIKELERVMERYRSGGAKYGDNNWTKGMPLSVYYDSANRHMMQWWQGDESEDHAAAVVWNMMCAMWTEKNLDNMNDKLNYPNK